MKIVKIKLSDIILLRSMSFRRRRMGYGGQVGATRGERVTLNVGSVEEFGDIIREISKSIRP